MICFNEIIGNDIHITLACMDISLGYDVTNWKECIVVDILIMHVKKYIYACKMNVKNPEIRSFKYSLQSNMNIIMQTNFKFTFECMNIIDGVLELLSF